MSLYDIDAELLELLAKVENGEEVESVAALLELNEQEHTAKLTGYAYAIQSYKAESSAYADEIKRLQARKKTCDNHVTWLKDRTLQSMTNRGIEKMKAGTLQLSHKQTQAVEVSDVGALPSDLVKVTTVGDKTAIKAAIKRGDDVQGATIVTNHSLGLR